MDSLKEIKGLIDQSKNIYILPNQEREESVINALALFYTLKELNKNVNLIIDEIPERLKFLIPSLDYISYPRNFVVGIPNSKAEISQIRYEKDEKDLKIYLTIDKGNIKKNDISFCFTEPKADALITLGLEELISKKQSDPLASDVLLNVPILNIDNQEANKNFGEINLVKPGRPLTETVLEIIKSIDEGLIKKNVANSLLAGVIIFSDNFHKPETSSETLETASFLLKKGASLQQVVDNLYRRGLLLQTKFLGQILNNLNTTENNNISFAVLDSPDFQNFGESEANLAIGQLKTIFDFKNLLVLWKSHASGPTSKGFFYSENYDLIKKTRNEYQGTVKNNAVFFSNENLDLNFIKNKTLNFLIS